jgi:hypothetical protein
MTTSVTGQARKAEQSDVARWGARAGLVARGLLWLSLGLVAGRVALGGGGKANKGGALQALRDQPLGKVLLVAMAIGFAAHAVFRLLEGTVGRRDEDDERKRNLKRVWSLCRVLIYGSLAVTTLGFAAGSGGSSDDAKGPTGRLMGMSGGRWLVGLIGIALVVGGLIVAFRALRHDFTEKLRMPGGRPGEVVKVVGSAGLTGRGLVYALVGSFLVQAAATVDPNKAKGLDDSLRTLAAQPFGAGLLWFAVCCLLAFALWSFLDARYREF